MNKYNDYTNAFTIDDTYNSDTSTGVLTITYNSSTNAFIGRLLNTNTTFSEDIINIKLNITVDVSIETNFTIIIF